MQQHRDTGKRTTGQPIPLSTIEEIKAVIAKYPTIGYSVLSKNFGEYHTKTVKVQYSCTLTRARLGYNYAKSYKFTYQIWKGYSKGKLNNNGIFTNNEAVLVKENGKLRSLTKIQEKQLNRVNFEDIRDIWTSQIDGSNVNFRSSRRANKATRTMKFTPDLLGNQYLKLYCLISRKGEGVIKVIKSKSIGEKKEHFTALIMENLHLVGKHVILDGQSKYNDLTDMGITIYHPKKSTTHPHNSEAENMFSRLAGHIHKDSKRINDMSIDTAKLHIEGLIKLIVSHEIPNGCKFALSVAPTISTANK